MSTQQFEIVVPITGITLIIGRVVDISGAGGDHNFVHGLKVRIGRADRESATPANVPKRGVVDPLLQKNIEGRLYDHPSLAFHVIFIAPRHVALPSPQREYGV